MLPVNIKLTCVDNVWSHLPEYFIKMSKFVIFTNRINGTIIQADLYIYTFIMKYITNNSKLQIIRLQRY